MSITRPGYRSAVFAVVVAIGSFGVFTGTSLAQNNPERFTDTPTFIEDCRSLATSKGTLGKSALNCRGMLEGAIGAFGLLSKKYYPISAQLGYCLIPGIKPKELAGVLVKFADANAECRQLSHFSMCLNMALQSVYPDSC